MDEQTLFSQGLVVQDVVQSSLCLGGFLWWLSPIHSSISCPGEAKSELGTPDAMSQVLEGEKHLLHAF